MWKTALIALGVIVVANLAKKSGFNPGGLLG